MRSLSVLVIDDEPLVGAAIGRLLRGQHQVRVVTSAREALLLCSGESPFDVIFCDLMMPGMTGAEFFREVLRARPDLARRIILMTGGAFTPETQRFMDEVSPPLLDKPFHRQSVLAALERCASTQASSEHARVEVQVLSKG